MKSLSCLIKKTRIARRLYNIGFKSLLVGALLLAAIQAPLQAQEYPYSKATFWIGAAGGANFNFHRGSTQQLSTSFTSPVAFHEGNNATLYLAPLLEIQSPTGLGASLQVGYDSRKSIFDQQITVCNCPADLTAKLTYITVEPSLRIAPFNSGFYLFGGPRLAFNMDKSFTYKLGINPAFPEQAPTPDVTGDLSDVRKTLISMQVGAGYDIPLAGQEHQTQVMFSPFVSFHPYFGQNPRSIETWNVTTVRVGAALKFGWGRLNPIPVQEPEAMIPTPTPVINFTVNSPSNIPTERRLRETFPLRNYVYFDLESTEIPDRYVMLTKNQTADFKEDQLEQFAPKRLSGRSARGMTVYYNVLNIIGDRLGKNPSANITLVGSSEKGPADGMLMAQSIKRYLNEVWNINNSRIATEGRDKPLVPSAEPGTTQYLKMLREGDRRVSIESTSPAMLMEFQSGPEAKLKPVEIIGLQEAPFDSYVTFNVDGARELSSWRLEIKDDAGKIQNFGPYTQEQVSIPGKSIMGTRPDGRYQVTMMGVTKSGLTLRKDAYVNMKLWTPPTDEEGMRYSVIYEFDESKALTTYDKYLTDVIVPKIPIGGTVILHGHTDIIGDAAYNQKLSLARANDVRKILESGLSKARRSDVKFEVRGFGQDESLSPYNNTLPEERAYNRTVTIDIIPRK